MKLKLTLIVTAMIVTAALSVFAWNNILTVKAPGDEQPMPVNKKEADGAELMERHPQTLDGSQEQGHTPLFSGDYWVQVNEDGFDADYEHKNKRAQAMFLQRFVEDDNKTWFYCGIEGVNHAEIWRTDGSYTNAPLVNWTNVTDHPTFDPNVAADCAIVWDKSGYEGLYVGTRNDANGTEILRRYYNGTTWEWVKVNEPSFGKKDDQGDPTNGHTRAMAAFTSSDNNTECLYVGTFNTTYGCEVWRTDGSLKDGGPEMNWTRVNYGGFGTASADEPDNICVMDMIVFNGDLYAGTYNRDGDFSGGSDDETTWSAGRIFRYAENASDIKEWVKVWDGVVGGSGADTCYALSARCFEVLGANLWVGLYHDSGDDFYTSAGGDSWAPGGIVETGHVNNIVDLVIYENLLYASSRRGEWTDNNDHEYVWRTANGSSWHKWSTDGFGDDYNRSIYCFGVFKGDLYAATWNMKTSWNTEDGTGCEVWKTTADATRITLDSFEAVARKDGSILLRWVTGTEIGTAGFDIYRSESPDFESFEKINPRIIEASGTPEAGAEYKVLDRSVDPGTFYYYFLVEIDVNGKMSTFGPVQARAKIPVPEVFEMYSAIIQMDTFGV